MRDNCLQAAPILSSALLAKTLAGRIGTKLTPDSPLADGSVRLAYDTGVRIEFADVMLIMSGKSTVTSIRPYLTPLSKIS